MTVNSERRYQGPDRRKRTMFALWVGSFKQRRQGPRRTEDRSVASIDTHHPQWLVIAILIMLLSVADAFLTLTVINLGAEEINPVMKPLVTGSGREFAIWKLALTAGGLVFLTITARLRTLGGFPIGGLLYCVLALYLTLVGYELWLVSYLSAQPHG